MDSRHESLKEGCLNHLIITINTYMKDNVDALVIDENLLNDLADICKRIYDYVDLQVDTENILSRHNLLSKDVVAFPEIQDAEGNKILSDTEFENLIFAVKNIAGKNVQTDDGMMRKQLLRVIEEYEL